jgi:hypothetical protein
MFKSFTEDGVVWSDGRHEAVDAVIFATGYRPNLAYLTGLGALDEAGRPRQRGGMSTTVPGLYYVGLPRQRNVASATLRGVGADAKIVAKHLRHYYAAQRQANGRPTTDEPVRLPVHQWGVRGSELIGLIGLLTFSLKEQLVTRPVATPRLVGEALVRSFIVGSGFLGFGAAANLYSQS